MDLSGSMRLDFEDLVRSSTMFFIDSEIESIFEAEQIFVVENYLNKLSTISTLTGLEEYIKSDKKSLENLLGLLNISVEKFKRIVSMIRLGMGFTVSSEWDLTRIRTVMIESPKFMDEICQLLSNGSRNPKYMTTIPKYYLDNFIIDEATMARLKNRDDLLRIVKKSMEVQYSKKIGNKVYELLNNEIANTCGRMGITYVENKFVPLVQRAVAFSIPNEITPRVIIEQSFISTTSSVQTTWRNEIESISQILKIESSNTSEIILLCFMDGAGWVARQSDMRAVYQSADYCFNINNLELLSRVLFSMNL